MMRYLGRSLRMVLLGAGSLLLLASGCAFSDVLEWSGAPVGDEAATSTPRAAPPSTTPIPTATMWAYTAATPTWGSDDLSAVTRTPTATVPPRATSTPAATSTPTPRPSPTPSPTPLVSLLPSLPTEADLPSGLRLQSEVEFLSVERIASEGGDSAEYSRLLAGWGYTRGAAREFQIPNPGVVDYLTKLLGFDARVMEFGSAADATAAIDYQRDFALSRPDWRLQETQVDRIGDAAIALTGTADYEGMEVRVTAVFVRAGAQVYRFVAVSGGYNAFDDAVAIARTVVERNR